MIGLTDTFTGVGCVKKFGISHDSMVLVAGLRIPLPMQINRILSTDGAVGPISIKNYLDVFSCDVLVQNRNNGFTNLPATSIATPWLWTQLYLTEGIQVRHELRLCWQR